MKRLVILLVALGLLMLAGPAYAADNKIGLSADGRTFTPALPGLFESELRIVPGVTQTRSFYVRNQSSDDAYLRVNVSEASGPLVELGEITATGTAADSTSMTTALTPGALLLEGAILAPGQVVKVDVTLALPAGSTNVSQALNGRLGFSVGLSQSEAVLPPAVPGGSGNGGTSNGDSVAGPRVDHNGVLPGTGSPVSQGVLLIAATLLGIGFALMRRHDVVEETLDA